MRAPDRARLWAAAVLVGIAVGVILPGLARAQEDDRARALELFEESAEHYRAGRFDRAAALLREAYDLEPEPVLLYNLARALEGAGQDQEAVDAYERYLASAGDEEEAEAARVRLEVLRARLDERARLEEQARAAERLGMELQPRAPEPSTDASDPVPWILAGTGAGLVVVGAIFGGLVLDRSAVAMDAEVHLTAAQALADAETYAIVADAFLGVGALVGLVGLIWGLSLLATGGDDEPASAALRVGPGTLSLLVRAP